MCGPLPRSGGRHKYKYIIIIFDHYTKYTKLYAISRATTKNILEVIIQKYLPAVSYTHLDVYKRQGKQNNKAPQRVLDAPGDTERLNRYRQTDTPTNCFRLE